MSEFKDAVVGEKFYLSNLEVELVKVDTSTAYVLNEGYTIKLGPTTLIQLITEEVKP